MHWLEYLMQYGRVARSRVPGLETGRMDYWINAGYLRGCEETYEVVSDRREEFREVAQRHLATVKERRSAAAPAVPPLEAEASGDDALCTYFLASEGADRLFACRLSEFAVAMAGHGLHTPKVGLVESADVVLQWRAGFLRRFGLEGCDVIVLTRGSELIRPSLWLALMDASAVEVRCAFDFDAEGVSFFMTALEALGGCCRVAWPEAIDEAFERQSRQAAGSRVHHAPGVKAELEGWAERADTNQDALRWARLMVEHGVAVDQRAFL